MLWRGLFGKGHQEIPLFLHLLSNYPPAKTAIDLSGQPMRVVFTWCTHWTQSFNSPVAHLMYMLVGGLVKASSFLFQQKIQQGSSKVPWVHGASLSLWCGKVQPHMQLHPRQDQSISTSSWWQQEWVSSFCMAASHFPPLEEPFLNLTYIFYLYQLHLLWFLKVWGEFSKVISPLFCHYKSMSANDRRPPFTPMHQSMYFLYCKCP